MGLAFKFGESARARFGNCSTDLQTITGIHFPSSESDSSLPPESSPAKETVYLRFRPDSAEFKTIEGLPPGESDYAVLYTVQTRPATRAETFERLRDGFLGNRDFSRFDPEKQSEFLAFIESRVEALHSGATPDLLEVAEVNPDGPIISYKKFERWVSIEEFSKQAATATKLIKDGAPEERVWVRDNWYFGKSFEEQHATCLTCDLNINPVVNRAAEKLSHELSQLNGQRLVSTLKLLSVAVINGTRSDSDLSALIPKSTDSDFAECVFVVLREAFKTPGLSDEVELLRAFTVELSLAPDRQPGCHADSSYSHWAGFASFLDKVSGPPLTTLKHYIKQSEGTVPVSSLDALFSDLVESRAILETEMVPSIAAFTADGTELYSIPYTSDWLDGDKHNGYGTGIDLETGLIAVEHQVPYSFLSLLRDDDLESEEPIPENPKFLFTEIYRTGDAFKGVLEWGREIELPPEVGPHGTLTPFSGLPHSDRITKIASSKLPAIRSFGYLQDLLERFVALGRKFQIPVKLG